MIELFKIGFSLFVAGLTLALIIRKKEPECPV
jgi:hypothetical protein